MTRFVAIARHARNLAGQRFGYLQVLGPVGRCGQGSISWLCRCDCGVEKAVRSPELVRPKDGTISCGCDAAKRIRARQFKHGRVATPEYRSWGSLVNRCLNPKNKQYPYYGGRGITVCAEWRSSFERFFADMGTKPSAKHSIDRKDNDGPYAPWNCRWATPLEQTINRRNTVRVTFNGQTKSLSEWAQERAIPHDALFGRIRNGWTTEEALTVPFDKERSDRQLRANAKRKAKRGTA